MSPLVWGFNSQQAWAPLSSTGSVHANGPVQCCHSAEPNSGVGPESQSCFRENHPLALPDSSVAHHARGLVAPRMSFTSDPFTPAQAWIDAEEVTATQEPDGSTLIKARAIACCWRTSFRSRFRMKFASAHLRIKTALVTAGLCWLMRVIVMVFCSIFFERSGKFGIGAILSLKPQFMIQRAFEGETDSYPEPGSKPGARDVNQPIDSADLFGLDARIDGYLGDGDYRLRSSFSSFNPNHLPNALRASGIYTQPLQMPFLGNVQAEALAPIAIAFGMVPLACKTSIPLLAAPLRNQQDLPELAGLQAFISGVLRPATTKAMLLKQLISLSNLGQLPMALCACLGPFGLANHCL